VIGAVFLTLLLQNNPSQREWDGPFGACARKRSVVRGRRNRQGPTPSPDAVLIGVTPATFLQRDTTAHGRYEGMKRNSTTR
jgi:hypothetical protein